MADDDNRRTVEISSRTIVESVDAVERREVAIAAPIVSEPVPGPQGPKGEDGKDGAPGSAGERGPRGRAGEDGAPGASGAKGDKGDDGDRGHKGDKGDEGNNAWTPEFAVVQAGERRLLRVKDWHSGSGEKPPVGVYLGEEGWVEKASDATDIRGRPGEQGPRGWSGGGGGTSSGSGGGTGADGAPGDNGWSPILATITDGERRVLQITDWTGGTGIKPPTGRYVGTTGLVTDIADAADIRGPAGADGTGSGSAGAMGAPGRDGEDGLDGHPGPSGADGADGAAGPQGMQGFPGVDGEDGRDGIPGPQGTQGTPGSDGAAGSQGMPGLPGVDGEDGRDGAPGPQGTPGASGSDGAAGPQGMQGFPGVDGEDGRDGLRGEQGDQGVAGPQGMQGFPGVDGEDGRDGLRGEQGEIGFDGCGGWTPELAVATDGDRRVLQVVDWIGGTCAMPSGLDVVGCSYSNSLGTGDRTASIAVTTNAVLGGGVISNLVDGATASNSTDSIFIDDGQAVSGLYIRFQFPTRRNIKQARWKQDNSVSSLGVWKWQGSDDALSWTDIGVSFTLGTNSSNLQIQTELRDNHFKFLYYRLLGVSGTTPATEPWIREVEFFIDGAVSEEGDTSYRYPVGGGIQFSGVTVDGTSGNGVDRNSLVTITSLRLNNNTNLVDGAGANNSTDSSDFVNAQTDAFIQFQFTIAQRIDEFTWEQNTSTGHGNWDLMASDDGVTWTTLSAAFSLVNGTTQRVLAFTNPDAYLYYKLLQVSGSTSSSPWVHEIYFKTCPTLLPSVWYVGDDGYVEDIADGVDIRGDRGLPGSDGADGSDGSGGGGSGGSPYQDFELITPSGASWTTSNLTTDDVLLVFEGVTSSSSYQLSLAYSTDFGGSWTTIGLIVTSSSIGAHVSPGQTLNHILEFTGLMHGRMKGDGVSTSGGFGLATPGIATDFLAWVNDGSKITNLRVTADAGTASGNIRVMTRDIGSTTGAGGGVPGRDGDDGDQGPPGPQGNDGATGAQGTPGAPGAQGVPGARGDDGDDGAPGYPGATGSQGTPGNDGAAGAQGVPGARGDDGDDGAPGYPGAQGIQGNAGNDGAPGSQGVPGARGDDGDDGAPGYPGATGAQGIQGTAGNDGSQGVPGPRGDDGDAGIPGIGIQGAPGSDGPQGIVGARGDDGDDGAPGYPGAPGAAGAQGTAGNDGSQGVPGARGDDGDDGAPGYPGAPGATGSQGTQGIAGNDGVVGPRGFEGDDGCAGPPGPQGPQGIQGVAGADGSSSGGGAATPGPRGDDGDDAVAVIQVVQNPTQIGLTTTQRDLITTPQLNQQIFNITTNQPEWYDGTVWRGFSGDVSLGGTAQRIGFTIANTMEVEATLAARLTLYPDEINNPPIGWYVNRFMGSNGNFSPNTTLGATDGPMFLIGLLSLLPPCLVIIKKITIWMCSGAIAGTRTGVINAKLWRTFVTSPTGSLAPSTQDVMQLDGRMGPFCSIIYSTTPSGIKTITTDTLELETACVGDTGVAGKNHFQNVVLHDHMVADHPIILFGSGACVQVTVSIPTAATSNTWQAYCNFEWDEWVQAPDR